MSRGSGVNRTGDAAGASRPAPIASAVVLDAPDVVFADLGEGALLFVHARRAPSDASVAKIVEHYERMGPRLAEAKALIVTDGGGPNARHRRDLEANFGAAMQSMRMSVVTDSGAIHFVLSAMSFFAKNVRSFAPGDFDHACDFADFDAPRLRRARATMSAIAAAAPVGRFEVFDKLMRRR